MAASPPASLIVFSYNQAAFIAEAAEAALAQDYPNLEILFSDDGSSDETVEVLRDILARYRGPHRVALNCRRGGEGILAHVYQAASITSGNLVVLAAGDDLSFPNRVSRLVAAWRESRANALCSACQPIDSEGNPTGPPIMPEFDKDMSRYFVGWHARSVLGAASAYDRAIFEAVKLPGVPVMAEDLFFSLMLGLRCRPVAVIEEPLVAYRCHGGAVSHLPGASIGAAEFERRSARNSEWRVALLELLLDYARDGERIDPSWGQPAELDFARINEDLAFYRYHRRWLEAPFGERLAALLRFRRWKHFRWLLPRLFGLGGLLRLKAARDAVRIGKRGPSLRS